MKKQKVLIDSQLLKNGGIENVLENLAVFLLRRDGGQRYDVTIAAVPKSLPTSVQDFRAVFPAEIHYVQRMKVRKGYKRYTIPWFLDTIICRLYDFAVECYLNLQHFDISISINTGNTMKRNSHIRAKQSYCWIQRDFRDYLPWGDNYAFQTKEQEFNCLKKYTKAVCVSESTRRGIIETMGDPGNLCVKFNPINVEAIRALAKEPCPVKKTPGKFLIVSMGRLHPEKQFSMLLQLAKTLSKTHELEVWIIGEGQERSNLESYIEQENLSFVKLLGFQVNPYMYLTQADLFVSCSCSESYGLAVQEAFVLGIPVVAIRNSGVEETFDPRFGIMVENYHDEIESALKTMLDDPALLKRYRANIAKSFHPFTLYEERLESICNLWE